MRVCVLYVYDVCIFTGEGDYLEAEIIRFEKDRELEALPEKKLSYREEHVASLRCDGLVSAVWRLSRSQGQTLFSQKKVFVNGRLTENGSLMLKDGDTVSVRGFGKFIFRGEKNTTKKGRLVIGADLFV